MTKFNYVGPINTTGYGVASTGYLKSLLSLEEDIGFKPIGQINGPMDPALLEKATKNFDPSAPTFCFWHLFDIPNQTKECTGPKVGMTTFELDSLKPNEVAVLRNLDAVCTASEWGKTVLSKYFEKGIHVIPHAFKQTEDETVLRYNKDLDFVAAWQQAIDPIKIDPDSLLLSTAGKYESRKGHPELIDACIEIGKEKPVVLVSFLHNPFIEDNFPYGFINSRFMYPAYTKSGIKVFNRGKFYLVLMPPTRERQELHAAISKADFFVSPSKGEGWNLPLFEMMSYGMPCITTLNTAHTDYCTPKNVINIESDSSEPMTKAFDGSFFDGSAQWHNITKETIEAGLRSAMHVKKYPNLVTDLVNESAKETRKYSWHQSAQMIVNLMKTF